MTTVSSVAPRTRRNVELVLLAARRRRSCVLAYVNVGLVRLRRLPARDWSRTAPGCSAISLAFHLLLRWKAAYADPLLLPIVTLLNGLGLVMIHRLDIAEGRDISEGLALRQLTWSALAVAIAAVVLWFLRDHRMLRRYTFTAAVVGFGLLHPAAAARHRAHRQRLAHLDRPGAVHLPAR